MATATGARAPTPCSSPEPSSSSRWRSSSTWTGSGSGCRTSSLDRIRGLLESTEQRLANDQFVEKAPDEVVEREREKADSFRDQQERLSRKLTALT